jgi:hypothetical protein
MLHGMYARTVDVSCYKSSAHIDARWTMYALCQSRRHKADRAAAAATCALWRTAPQQGRVVLTGTKPTLIASVCSFSLRGSMAAPQAPVPGEVRKCNRGYEASFGALVVGTFASQELAERALDLLKLKAAVDNGTALKAINFWRPLEVSHCGDLQQ